MIKVSDNSLNLKNIGVFSGHLFHESQSLYNPYGFAYYVTKLIYQNDCINDWY